MKVVIVQGSTRADSQSAKVAKRIQEKLTSLKADVELIDLFKVALPVYDDSGQKEWEVIKPRLENADAFVLITPEWDGSASPGIMNFLTFTSVGKQKPLAHRPAIIVSVSSGAGGSYPIAQLKAFGNKNNHPVFIPEHLRFRTVKTILNGQEPENGNEVDKSMHERTEHSLKVLLAYAEKLSEIRQAGIPDIESYPNGN